MASNEKCFYLSQDYKLGWDYDNNCNTAIPQLTDRTLISFSSFCCDVFKCKIEDISECIKKIFVSAKDFVQLFMDRRQFVFDFMDFLIKNHGTNDMILAVNCHSGKVDYSHNYRSKVLAAFEEKYANLFETEKIEGLSFNDEQNRVPCSTMILSNSGKLEIKNILLVDILYSYFTRKICPDACLRQGLVQGCPTFATNDVRFDILAEQIFHLYWLRKSVKNEINSLNFKKNWKFPSLLLEDIEKKCQKLKVYDQEMKKLWYQTISNCSEILKGSTKTESDLIAELSPHLLFALRNEFGTESPYNNERISRLKLDDESDESATSVQKQDLPESNSITMNNKDYRSLQSEMAELLKMDIVLSNKALKPFVKTQDSNERVLLGFGFHQNQYKPKTTEASEMFISPCPKECTIDDRQWICINCGEFFKALGFQVVCSCGTTHVTNLKLECFDSKHPKDFFPCEKHDPTSASITSSRRSSFSVVEEEH